MLLLPVGYSAEGATVPDNEGEGEKSKEIMNIFTMVTWQHDGYKKIELNLSIFNCQGSSRGPLKLPSPQQVNVEVVDGLSTMCSIIHNYNRQKRNAIILQYFLDQSLQSKVLQEGCTPLPVLLIQLAHTPGFPPLKISCIYETTITYLLYTLRQAFPS